MRPLFWWVRRLRGVALAGVILISGTAQAAITGKIVGRVTDANHTPLPGTAVVIEGRQLGATTDPDGQYFILQVSPGTYTLEAHLVGYQPVRQQSVVVNLDRTTRVDFVLSESAIEVEAITVTAERPIVEQDVTSSQVFISAQTAQQLPVRTLLDALALQPGIDVTNRTTISVRGSTPDQISFQVDGFEQTNPLENRSYTAMNQAMVQEVQLLTGAFTAEYASRAAVVNVVTKDPGQIPTFAGDVRYVPARRQHFGPDAFGADEFDRLLYANSGTSTKGRMFNAVTLNASKQPATWTDAVNSNKPVYLADMTTDLVRPEVSSVFLGWDSLAVLANKGTYMASDPLVAAYKGFWTAAGMQEVWNWQHRAVPYHDQGDYYIDAAVTVPLVVIPRSGFVIGYKDTRAVMAFPTVLDAFTDRVLEGTFKSSIIPSIKLEARGRYEVTRTPVAGGNLDVNNDLSINNASSIGFVQNAFSSMMNQSKYYVDGNVPYKETITGGSARLTHTLSPSTYYTVSYEYLAGKVNAHPGNPRIAIKNYKTGRAAPLLGSTDSLYAVVDSFQMGGKLVRLDEAPNGALGGENLSQDIALRYYMQGGANLSDYSEWQSNKVRADFYSQVDPNNAVKLGAEYDFNHLIRDSRRMNRVNSMNGWWDRYDASPRQYGFYAQDKMEYEGLVANFGVRLDGYDANGIIMFPGQDFPDVFVRGNLYAYLRSVGINPSNFTANSVAYLDSPRSHDPGWTLFKLIEQTVPHEYSKTFWRFSPRIGISHPIGTATKFFFNFGWMYSMPKSGFLYGYGSENAQIGTSGSEVRQAPNPNLDPPSTVVYEVGFEQSVRNTYVIRAKGYSKDDKDSPGAVQRYGLGSSVISGGPGRMNVVFSTYISKGFTTYRGLEVTAEKARGRYITGNLTFDFRVITVGQTGYNIEYEDPRLLDLPPVIALNQPQFSPTSHASIVFRTPTDWGMAAGNWSMSIIEYYNRGTKSVYYPGNDQNNPKVFRWVDSWNTNARVQKSVNVGGRSATLYMDVQNLFNQKTINTGALVNSTIYFEQMLMVADKNGRIQPKYKIGDSRFNDEIYRRLVRDNDWLMFLNPREFQFGVRVDL